MMPFKSLLLVALFATFAVARNTLLWMEYWSESFANCDPWRAKCSAMITKPDTVDLLKMCKPIKEGDWKVIKVGCPDPADPTDAGEAARIEQINRELQYLTVMTFDHVELGTLKPDQLESKFRADCTQAAIKAQLIDPHTYVGFCSIKAVGGGYEATLACPVNGIAEGYGWKRIENADK